MRLYKYILYHDIEETIKYIITFSHETLPYYYGNYERYDIGLNNESIFINQGYTYENKVIGKWIFSYRNNKYWL